MYVIMRKFSEDENWNICGVACDKPTADIQVEKEIKTGREACCYTAHMVWIAENGNHTWTA